MLIGVVPVFMKFFPPDGAATANQDHRRHLNSARHFWYLYILVTIASFTVSAIPADPIAAAADQVRFKLPAFGPFLPCCHGPLYQDHVNPPGWGIPALQALETAGTCLGRYF